MTNEKPSAFHRDSYRKYFQEIEGLAESLSAIVSRLEELTMSREIPELLPHGESVVDQVRRSERLGSDALDWLNGAVRLRHLNPYKDDHSPDDVDDDVYVPTEITDPYDDQSGPCPTCGGLACMSVCREGF